jgi:HEAT repeat protein
MDTPSELPREIWTALESDDAGPLDAIIRRHRQEDFELFRRILNDVNAPELYRMRSMYALGRWGDPRVVPEIVRAMETLSDRGRISAIDALGRLRAEDALDTLVRYAQHPSPHVRKTVANALARIDTPPAHAELQAIAARDPEDWVRKVALKKTRAQ